MKAFLSAGLALAACAALAGVSQNFDDLTTVPTTGWGVATGSTAEIEEAPSSVQGVSGKVLAVDGTVTCSNTGDASQWATTSFFVLAPEESSSDLPSGDEVSGCQIAVATGEEDSADGSLKVMVYRGKQGEETAAVWADTGKKVAKGGWFSVALNFDYSGNEVQLLINGESAGWYPLVTTKPKTSKVDSIAFVGMTKVDDVAIAEVNAVPAASLPDSLKGLEINLSTLEISRADLEGTTKYAGLTVAERVEAGLAPKDETTFAATALTPAADGKLSVSVPCAFDNGQAYEVWVNGEKVESTQAFVKDEQGDITGVNLSFAPGSAKVLKIQVKAVGAAQSAQ